MSFFTALRDLLFPPKCAFCGVIVPRGTEEICAECRKKLPYRRRGEKKSEFVPFIAAPLYYEGMVRDSLHGFKFSARESRAAGYAVLMAEAVESIPGEWDTLSWVPLHRKRLRQRGYDQSERLARELGKRLGMAPVRLLAKKRNAPPQSRTGDAAARRANISGCYALEEGADVTGKRILLVDDICTTGATLSECARMLKMHGAGEVYAVVVAVPRE